MRLRSKLLFTDPHGGRDERCTVVAAPEAFFICNNQQHPKLRCGFHPTQLTQRTHRTQHNKRNKLQGRNDRFYPCVLVVFVAFVAHFSCVHCVRCVRCVGWKPRFTLFWSLDGSLKVK